MIARRSIPPGELALAIAMRPWERRLTIEALQHWLLHGAIAALAVASIVLLVGWVTPMPEADLRPYALGVAIAPIVAALAAGAWPRRHARRAAQLDVRLRFGDRLATAWAYRGFDGSIVELQRDDAVNRLRERVPKKELTWRAPRIELAVLAGVALITLVLFVAPSPQQAVLDRQANDELAVQQASDQLDVLRQAAIDTQTLTPTQVDQLNMLLRQTEAQLAEARTHDQAAAILSSTQDQVAQQLADPNAELRDEALAAMSQTLAAEPQTVPLANAIQREDPQAIKQALDQLAAQADQESDVERQALSRALQRASNVGRGDPRSAQALHDAAQALASPGDASSALSNTNSALQDAVRASQGQQSVNATLDRLRQLQEELASGAPMTTDPSSQTANRPGSSTNMLTDATGTPVPLDSSGFSLAAARDPSTTEAGTAGGVAQGNDLGQPVDTSTAEGPENVFVPGRESNGPADQNLVDQPFTMRGAPRPYRDVLSQYAQSSRDYVDRPDISPAVRDLVKEYFQNLEEGQ